MRPSHRGHRHGRKAAKQAVSPSINSDVSVQAQLQAEIRQDLDAVSSYIARHGSFAEMVRQHYQDNEEG
jgi:hypothetical protein